LNDDVLECSDELADLVK